MDSLSPVHRDIVLLREAIQQHENYYYVLRRPIITDFDYDILKKCLIDLEEANPEYNCTTSPIYRYENLKQPGHRTVPHVARMLEFNRGTDLKSVGEFMVSIKRGKRSEEANYIFEPIVDGVDVELVYLRGRFKQAVLRVDGTEGIDVSQSVRALKGFRLRLFEDPRPCPRVLSIHAKFFVTEKELHEANFKQTREGARSFLSIKAWVKHLLVDDDLWTVTKSPLKYLCIDILDGDEDMVDLTEIREALTQWRLPINPVISEVEESAYSAREYRDEFISKGVNLPYHCTGVMIKVHETCIRDELGVSRADVRWAFKLMYPPIERSARILEINFEIDQRGVVVATARTRPVYLAGMNVNAARFEHADDVQSNDIRVGDVAWLERDGERMPFVRKRLLNTDRIGPRVPTRVPTHCPECQKELKRRNDVLRCVNKYECPAQINFGLLHFISEAGFNIRHLGPARCKHLIEQKLVKDFADLFQLKWEDFLGLPYVKEGRARMIVDEINKSRRIRLRKFLFALNIPGVGQIASGELERVFHSLDAIIAASHQRFLRLRSVGPESARSIYFYFREPENLALISKLLDNGVVPYTQSMVGHRKKIFAGMLVVVAGSLRKYRRNDLIRLIESEGGRVTTEVVKSADLLIYGRGAERRVRLARKYNVRDWNEVQLLRNLLQYGVG